MAASVNPTPEVVQLGMVEVVVVGVPPLSVHTGVPAGGSPMAPLLTVKASVNVPLLVVVTIFSCEQLTGT